MRFIRNSTASGSEPTWTPQMLVGSRQARYRSRFSTTLFLLSLMLAACAHLPFAAPGPGETVKRFLAAFYQGNQEEMMKYLTTAAQAELAQAKAAKDRLFGSWGDAIEKGATKLLTAAMQQEINSKGGITAIEIDREHITGDTATVDFTIRFGNGTATSSQARCLKENGVWKMASNK